MRKSIQWFEEWFDSPYYHILYKERNDKEAILFIDNLLDYLKPTSNQNFLDIGCGKGRHAVYLNSKGYNVIGVDLSSNSIDFASQYANEHLHFSKHDMRQPFLAEGFEYCLNLFTSFGFFDSHAENLQAIQAMYDNLKKGGVLVLDFMNPTFVQHHLVAQEKKEVEGIDFQIQRKVQQSNLIKRILFEVNKQTYDYEEKVELIKKDDFLEYFQSVGFEVKYIAGDYFLEEFEQDRSERMIFFAHKPWG